MSPLDLRETSLGFYRAWHIALGVEHGFLGRLKDAALDAGALARSGGMDEEAVALWCEGAWALGLVTKDKASRYRLAREHRKTLGEPASTDYIGHHFHYLAKKSLTFGAMGERLRGERPQLDLAATYAIATQYDHVASLDALPASLRRALKAGLDVLDLGAGHGGWSRAAKKAYPASRISAADLDVRPLSGLEGVRVLDARRLTAASFDLVHLGEVLAASAHPDEVLRSAHDALRPGGRLLCIEGLRPEGPPKDWGERLVLAMGLDFSMDGSRYLTPTQAREAFRRAGFRDLRLRDLGGSLFLLHARKPQTSSRG